MFHLFCYETSTFAKLTMAKTNNNYIKCLFSLY